MYAKSLSFGSRLLNLVCNKKNYVTTLINTESSTRYKNYFSVPVKRSSAAEQHVVIFWLIFHGCVCVCVCMCVLRCKINVWNKACT